jgi:hypothetical protein
MVEVSLDYSTVKDLSNLSRNKKDSLIKNLLKILLSQKDHKNQPNNIPKQENHKKEVRLIKRIKHQPDQNQQVNFKNNKYNKKNKGNKENKKKLVMRKNNQVQNSRVDIRENKNRDRLEGDRMIDQEVIDQEVIDLEVIEVSTEQINFREKIHLNNLIREMGKENNINNLIRKQIGKILQVKTIQNLKKIRIDLKENFQTIQIRNQQISQQDMDLVIDHHLMVDEIMIRVDLIEMMGHGGMVQMRKYGRRIPGRIGATEETRNRMVKMTGKVHLTIE